MIPPKTCFLVVKKSYPIVARWMLPISPATKQINTSLSEYFTEDCLMNKTEYPPGLSERLKLKVGAVATVEAWESEPQVVSKLATGMPVRFRISIVGTVATIDKSHTFMLCLMLARQKKNPLHQILGFQGAENFNAWMQSNQFHWLSLWDSLNCWPLWSLG